MCTPLLDVGGQSFLRPCFCHLTVLLALAVGQLLLELIAGFTVVAEVVSRTWSLFTDIDCQFMYCLAVHGGHDISVGPFPAIKPIFIRFSFYFTVEVFANKLKVSQHSIV